MIPKIVHFIYFLSPDFPLYAYLAIKSAQVTLKPEKILFYRGQNDPPIEGEWWNKASELVEVVTVQPPTEIFGRALKHPAHQADVFRLRTLIERGGIYLDLDTICRKPFEPLLSHQCVMGQQSNDGNYGLCNAVMLATPEALFLRTWLDKYSSFRSTGRDQYWDEHSVKLPLRLSPGFVQGDSPSLRIEPKATFFKPGYRWPELRQLFESSETFPATFCHHLWSNFSYSRYLKRLSPSIIRTVDTSYNLLCRPLLDT